jgi:predicted nucleotidyltransferase
MDPLDHIIRDRLTASLPEAIDALTEEMRRRFGDAVDAVIFYGSCLRKQDPLDGVVDLYVIVASYHQAYPTRTAMLLAAVLPPTVGYVELDSPAGRLRAKFAVISMRDFRRGTCGKWFQPYLWGRFAQPCVLAYARSEGLTDQVVGCIAGACRTLIGRTVAVARLPASAADLWKNALDLSYGTELRPEPAGRAREIVESNLAYYRDVTTALAPGLGLSAVDGGTGMPTYSLPVSAARVRRTSIAWMVRRVTGKLRSPARWLKALATFEGGLDYAVWKLERHSGTRIEVPERVRRRPWLHIWGELWRLYRSGVLR